MSSTDGMRRPQPLASTSSSARRTRTAKRASESTELGGAQAIDKIVTRDSRGQRTIDEESPYVIVESPNESSSLGLSRPMLIEHEPEVIDARNRGSIATRLLNLIGLILIVTTVAVVAATFTAVPASALITYVEWVASALIPLFTMALGYYFGTAQQTRHLKR
jgi:hypothetical protein